LVKAGLQVVSRHGYADASVSRIAEAAGVAAGTLYSYFESHQQLLDELLPAEGVRLLGVLAKSAHQSTDYFDHETRTFRAFITYLKRNPHFLRVLAEAETAAPRSHAQHMRNIEERYLRALHLAERRGEIRPHNDASFRVIAEVLAGARGHIAMGFCDRSGARSLRPKQIPEWVADTYVKFVRHGLGYAAALDLPRRMAASTQAPRPQLQQGTRASLINSAARVINRSGYLGATVQAITQAAGVAVGTFYAHFRSQRELFEELLCSMRTQMQAEVAEAIRGSRSFVELESRGFTGFFDYLVRNPWYVRVEMEAAVWVPASFRQHFFDIADRYVNALRRSRTRGELKIYEERELPILAYTFMAARQYLARRYVIATAKPRRLPTYVGDTYIELVRRGLER